MRLGTALLMATIALLGGAACGGEAAVSASPPPSAPKGGPVPGELSGSWTDTGDPTIGLNLSGDSYAMGPPGSIAHGKVAVNGSEIDYYNSDSCLPLPGGIGKYRWTIAGGLLTFTALNADPCSRAPYLADPTGWRRAS